MLIDCNFQILLKYPAALLPSVGKYTAYYAGEYDLI